MGNSQSDMNGDYDEPYESSSSDEAEQAGRDHRASHEPAEIGNASGSSRTGADSGSATTQDGERIRTATENVRSLMVDGDGDTEASVEMRRDSTEKSRGSVESTEAISSVEKVPVQFVWTHGGHEVFVVYSGDNWSQKHRMHKSFHDFSLILAVSPDVFYYKFIVDNQWRCAPDQDHVRDIHGAYSNVTVVQPQSVVSFIEENEAGHGKKRGRMGSIDLLGDKDYSQTLPEPESYISEPPLAPPQLGHILLNHPPTRDNHPLVLSKPPHVSLNHLYVADKREQEVVTFGITQRFRKKFFTTVYYKPITVNEHIYSGSHVIVSDGDEREEAGSGLSSSVISDYVQHNPYAEVV